MVFNKKVPLVSAGLYGFIQLDYTHDIPLLLVKVKVKITVCKTELIHVSYNLTAKVVQKMRNDIK